MARPKGSKAKTKTTARKTTAGRKTMSSAKTGAIKMLSAKSGKGTRSNGTRSNGTRRPPNNSDVPQYTIDNLNSELNQIKNTLEDYAAHLRALDRKRLNGVGIKKLGFIERSYELALENGEYLPHYLTIDRFGEDIEYFLAFRSLVDITDQIREKLWNITIQSADIAYTDALEFYASVREAAKRRVDSAETLHNDLSTFFKKSKTETEEPTEKKALRDMKSLIHGKHDGRLFIESEKPKLTGGKRKIIDETFKDTVQFSDRMSAGVVDGEIRE
jgi:hypothetical protein